MNAENKKMSEQSPSSAKGNVAPSIPRSLPLELLPLYDWWKAKGGQFLIALVTALLLAGGALVYRQVRASRSIAANRDLMRAVSIEDLEAVVAQHGTTRVGNAARLRLAKAYFDASRYADALATYDACLKHRAPSGFDEIARLGRAHALEGLHRLDEAKAAYEALIAQLPADHFLAPQAEMGVARVLTLQGQREEARQRLEELKTRLTGQPAWELAIAQLDSVLARYEPRAARSLFDLADQAAAGLPSPDAPPPSPPSGVIKSQPVPPVAVSPDGQ